MAQRWPKRPATWAPRPAGRRCLPLFGGRHRWRHLRAGCVSAHVRICAGGAGQPASLPRNRRQATPSTRWIEIEDVATRSVLNIDPRTGENALSDRLSQPRARRACGVRPRPGGWVARSDRGIDSPRGVVRNLWTTEARSSSRARIRLGEHRRSLGEADLQLLHQPGVGCVHLGSRRLLEDRPHRRRHQRLRALRHACQEVAREVGAALLPPSPPARRRGHTRVGPRPRTPGFARPIIP